MAVKKNTAAGVADTAKTEGREVEGIYVRAVAERRCRAGFCFDREGQGFAEGVLSDAQIAELDADPLLKLERGTFTDNAASAE
jgi:hypothetical protein